MKIAVLGTGSVGATLGRLWSRLGHAVAYGTRDVTSAKVQALLNEAAPQAVTAGSWVEASDGTELVLLAVPWPKAFDVLQATREALAGKILIDCINPLNATFTGLDLGFDTSAAEEIAKLVPSTRVVKAFNTVSAATMANPIYDGKAANLFYCGDDDAAKQQVAALAEQSGFAPVDAGPLRNARYLEPTAMLYIHLAMHGWGSNCALQIVKR